MEYFNDQESQAILWRRRNLSVGRIPDDIMECLKTLAFGVALKGEYIHRDIDISFDPEEPTSIPVGVYDVSDGMPERPLEKKAKTGSQRVSRHRKRLRLKKTLDQLIEDRPDTLRKAGEYRDAIDKKLLQNIVTTYNKLEPGSATSPSSVHKLSGSDEVLISKSAKLSPESFLALTSLIGDFHSDAPGANNGTNVGVLSVESINYFNPVVRRDCPEWLSHDCLFRQFYHKLKTKRPKIFECDAHFLLGYYRRSRSEYELWLIYFSQRKKGKNKPWNPDRMRKYRERLVRFGDEVTKNPGPLYG